MEVKRIYEGQKLKSGSVVTKIYYYNYQCEEPYVIYEIDNKTVTYGSYKEINDSMSSLQGECMLMRDFSHGKKTKEWINSQIATALNAHFNSDERKCEEILKKCISSIEKKELARKKRIYIGVYLLMLVFILLIRIILTALGKDFAFSKYISVSLFGAMGGFIALNTKLAKINFSMYETTLNYIMVAIYKVVFSCLSSIIVYFLIQGDLVLSALKDNGDVIYVASALGGFSETLLPNFFSGMEKDIINKE